jgi:hypothetical protein
MKGVKMAIRVFIKRTCEDPSKEKELVANQLPAETQQKEKVSCNWGTAFQYHVLILRKILTSSFAKE